MTELPPFRFNHLGIMVSDLPAAIRWYCSALGCTVIDQWDAPDIRMAWAHLSLDDTILEFVQRPALAEPSPDRTGLHHLALTVADCVASTNALVTHGAGLVSPPAYFERHDMDWSFVSDPFENVLEIVSYRTPHSGPPGPTK